MLSVPEIKAVRRLFLAVVLLFFSSVYLLKAENASLPDVVSNIDTTIKDIDGKVRNPFESEHSIASVLIFITHDCPISNAYSPELSRLRNEYEEKGFKMMLIYVDPDASTEGIKVHLKEYSLVGYTAIADPTHRLVKATGATVTPEVAVVLPDGSISYRGRIDNMYPALGQRRRVITEKDLRNALNAIIENKPVKIARTQAVGCYMPNLQF